MQLFINLPEVPAELQKALENTLRYGNPMGESARKRATWVESADVPVRILRNDPGPVDVLWFVECYPSYHPRGQDATIPTHRGPGAVGPGRERTVRAAQHHGDLPPNTSEDVHEKSYDDLRRELEDLNAAPVRDAEAAMHLPVPRCAELSPEHRRENP